MSGARISRRFSAVLASFMLSFFGVLVVGAFVLASGTTDAGGSGALPTTSAAPATRQAPTIDPASLKFTVQFTGSQIRPDQLDGFLKDNDNKPKVYVQPENSDTLGQEMTATTSPPYEVILTDVVGKQICVRRPLIGAGWKVAMPQLHQNNRIKSVIIDCSDVIKEGSALTIDLEVRKP